MNPLHPLLFCLGVPLLFAAAKYLKDLEVRVGGWLLGPLAAGAISGAVLAAVEREARPALRVPLLFVLAAAGALWLFRREHAPDAFEGLLRGGLFACGSGIPLTLATDHGFETIAIVLVAAVSAGAVASWMSDATSRVATTGFVVAAAAIAGAGTTSAVQVVDPAALAWIVALGTGIVVAASPFLLFPGVVEELEQESELGVLPAAMVARLGRPLRRLARGGLEPEAHRRLAQVAWRLALRRRRHRSTGLTDSRLHQVEILKLRKELGDLLRATAVTSGPDEVEAPRIQSSPKGTPTE